VWYTVTVAAPAMPGKKYASIKKPAMYEGLRKAGKSKESAARISNAAAKKSRKRRKTPMKKKK